MEHDLLPEPAEDPVLTSSRRESILAFVTWGAAMIYTVTYCYLFGYNRPIESLTFVLGIPDWVFWGVLAPWLVCLVLSALFAFVIIEDVDLGKDPDEPTEAGNPEDAFGSSDFGSESFSRSGGGDA